MQDEFDDPAEIERDSEEEERERESPAQPTFKIVADTPKRRRVSKSKLPVGRTEKETAYLQRLNKVMDMITTTEVFRKSPKFTSEGVQLKVNKQIYRNEQGVDFVRDLEPIIERDHRGGTYQVIYKDGTGRNRVQYRFEIDGPPLATPAEIKMHEQAYSPLSRHGVYGAS